MPAARFAAGQELRIAQAIPMQCVTGRVFLRPDLPRRRPRRAPGARPGHAAPRALEQVPRYLAMHDCVEPNGALCAFAPRSVLQLVLERYAARPDGRWSRPRSSSISPPQHRPAPAAGAAARPQRPRRGRAVGLQPGRMLNELAPFWDEFHAALDALGIAADTWIHEVGTTQYEINLLHGDALAVADQAFLFKLAAKEVALRHG
jgi:glutamine synthetase